MWTPQPAGAATGSYFLRGRTRDVAGNWSAWSTLFNFLYDATPPENPSEVTHADGVTSGVWQRKTSLANFTWPTPRDEGSGIKGAYVVWSTDPAGTDGPFIVGNSFQSVTPLCAAGTACTGYLRVRSVDNTDNMHSVYLEVNPAQPRSDNFRLFDNAMNAGNGEHLSLTYTSQSTVGHTVGADQMTSQSFSLIGGYQAGSRAQPIVEPDHDEFLFINGVFASGRTDLTLQSSAFRMLGTLGKPGVPNNEATLASRGFQLQPGFLASGRRSAPPPQIDEPGSVLVSLPAPPRSLQELRSAAASSLPA